MTRPFTATHLAAWLDLIHQAQRFTNPKVLDPSRLRAAGDAAGRAVLPPRYQNIRGSCFARLVYLARSIAEFDDSARKVLCHDACACQEHLIERATSLGRLQDALTDLATRDFQQFRMDLTNLMFPAPEPRQQRRYRADIDA